MEFGRDWRISSCSGSHKAESIPSATSYVATAPAVSVTVTVFAAAGSPFIGSGPQALGSSLFLTSGEEMDNMKRREEGEYFHRSLTASSLFTSA